MINDFYTHLPVLLEVLIQTDGSVLELGMGIGSTPVLHGCCKGTISTLPRDLVSMEDDERFCMLLSGYGTGRHQIRHVTDWPKALEVVEAQLQPEVVFVDNGCVDNAHKAYALRKQCIYQLGTKPRVVVLHDANMPDFGDDEEFQALVRTSSRYIYTRLMPWTLVFGWGEVAQRVVSELLDTKRSLVGV